MEKYSILLKLSYKFSKQYMQSYLSALVKPILFGILGILLLFCTMINPILIVLGFLSIPFCCYAFWRGFVITYALIACADNYIKNTALPFDNFVKDLKKNENSFVKYVCYMAILSILLYIPGVYLIWGIIPHSIDILLNPAGLLEYSSKIDNIFLINTLIAAPFLNYALCAFYYKKEHENFFNLFLNCYKKLDLYGLLIALIIVLFSYKGSFLYIILALILNPFIYSINTFWYSTKIKK